MKKKSRKKTNGKAAKDHRKCRTKMRLIRKKVDGVEVRLYKCPKCGVEVLNAGEAQKVLDSRMSRIHKSSRALNAREWILLLLGVQEDRKLHGAVLLMKQVFLAIKELSDKIGLSTRDVSFFPYKYGPYSRQVSSWLDRLEEGGYIIVKGRRSTYKESFSLTRKGVREARMIIRGLDQRAVKSLARARKSWDQLQNRGILKKVYSEYPYYRKKSEIEDIVLSGRRRA